MKSVAIFEPWGLGDLVVPLIVAYNLSSKKVKVHIVCDPTWSGLVEQFDFVDSVFTFYAPWADKQGQYDPRKYSIKDFIDIRHYLISQNVSCIYDARSDLRHWAILNLMNAAQVEIPRYPNGINIYERPEFILEDMSMLERKVDKKINNSKIDKKKDIEKVVCFFGGSDYNRRVPFSKARDILVKVLLLEPLCVKVLLDPDSIAHKWRNMVSSLDRVSVFEGTPGECLSVVSDSDLCISTDSGWLHIASFLGLKTVGLFAFQTEDVWSPPETIVIHPEDPPPAKYRYRSEYSDIQPLGDLNVPDTFKKIDRNLI